MYLLHKDFPDELPVFGAAGTGPGGRTGVEVSQGQELLPAFQKSTVKEPCHSQMRPAVHVLMVLGTVRDMTEAEQVCVLCVCLSVCLSVCVCVC